MTIGDQVVRVLRRNLYQAISNRRLNEAEALLGQLKQEDPLSLETRGFELDYLIATKQLSDAKTMADRLLHLFPQSARIQYLAGKVYYRIKKYSEALQCFNESKIIHSHWRTLRWLGKTQTQLGQFSEAEATLVAVSAEHIVINFDLAWLYERMNQPSRALELVETYLAKKPDDEFAKAQRLRLRAQIQEPEALSDDVDTLLDLDEEIPVEMLPAYLRNLLESGQGKLARQFVLKYQTQFDEQTAASLGWICHRLQAYDLAMNLFIQGLAKRTNDVKYLSALESAARHCQRVEELIEQYASKAPDAKRLYGRKNQLEKWINAAKK